MTLGEIVKEYRDVHNISMDVFAARSGLSKGYISMLEKNVNPKNGKPIKPSIDTIKFVAAAMNVDIDNLVKRLDDNQEIVLDTHLPEMPIAIKPTKNIPIVGTVACGNPIYAEENILEYIAVNATDKVDFALYAEGDSMNACKIDDGDTVFIRSQSIVENGEIALVLVDDSATIKRFYDYGDKIVLRPDSTNPSHKEQVYNKKDYNLSVQGKVIFIKTFVQ